MEWSLSLNQSAVGRQKRSTDVLIHC